MSSQNISKTKNHIDLTTKEILKGNIYKCFDSDNLKLFIESITSGQIKPFFLQQAKALLMLSWFIPKYPIKRLLTLTSNNFKIFYKSRIEIKIPHLKKIVIFLSVDGQEDPLAAELYRYIHLGVALSGSGSFRYFKELQSTYIDRKGYPDHSRKLRYHLRRWLKNYYKKVESVN